MYAFSYFNMDLAWAELISFSSDISWECFFFACIYATSLWSLQSCKSFFSLQIMNIWYFNPLLMHQLVICKYRIIWIITQLAYLILPLFFYSVLFVPLLWSQHLQVALIILRVLFPYQISASPVWCDITFRIEFPLLIPQF